MMLPRKIGENENVSIHGHSRMPPSSGGGYPSDDLGAIGAVIGGGLFFVIMYGLDYITHL